MSKASEYVSARARATALEIKPLDWPAYMMSAPNKDIFLTAHVTTLDTAPALRLTDVRMDAIVLEANAAIGLARWILDTFGGTP